MTKKQLTMFKYAKLLFGWHTLFSQKVDIVDKLKVQTKGFCHGVALSWLAGMRKHQLFTINKMRKMYKDGSELNKLINRQLGQVILRTHFTAFQGELKSIGLSHDPNKSKGFMSSDVYKIGLKIQEGAHGSYWLLSTNNHAMAAVCLGLTIFFFDPNAGQVIFTGGLAFAAFLHLYLHDDYVERDYQILGGITLRELSSI
jgi:hypothetical protein